MTELNEDTLDAADARAAEEQLAEAAARAKAETKESEPEFGTPTKKVYLAEDMKVSVGGVEIEGIADGGMIEVKPDDQVVEEPSREEWLKWRQDGIGSSDAAAVHGASDWKTPLDIYEEKVAKEIVEETSFIMEKGNEFEPKARQIFASQYNLEHGTNEVFEAARYVMPELPHMRASCDGVSFSVEDLAEFKYQGAKAHANVENKELPIKGGRVPLKYWIQCQHQLLVTGAKRCHFVSYNPKVDKFSVNVCVIERDEEFMAQHIQVCADFWLCVTKKKAPKETDRDYKVMRKKGAKELVNKYFALKKQAEELDAEMEAVKTQLTSMANHPRMTCGGYRLRKETRKGNLAYAKIPGVGKILAGFTDEQLDEYRGKSSTYWKIEDPNAKKKTNAADKTT